MAVNLITLNAMTESPYSLALYDTLGSYIFEYLLSEDHQVSAKIEERTIKLLKQCNKFAKANQMRNLCEIYEVFGLEQDAMIIYHRIVKHLVEKKQSVEEIDIKIRRKFN